VIELSKDSKSQPTVSDSLVQIEDNGHLYTFAAEKASWTSPTDMTLQPAEETMKLELQGSSDADVPGKTTRLADEFRKWRVSLPRYKKEGMDFNTQYSRQEATFRLWAARQRWMPELKSKVEELRRLVDASDSGSGLDEGIDATELEGQIRLEQEIATLQVKLNALRSTNPQASNAATPQPDKAALRKQVEQAFDVRQQLQVLEAQKLRLKLQLIEANLTTRQKNRDGIIARRVEELITSGIDSLSKQTTKSSPTHQVELLVFTASYCGPCQQMMPILTRMIQEGLPVRIVDITTEHEQSRRFRIDRIPTFVVTMDGQESRRFIGIQTEAELRRAMNAGTRESDSAKVTTSSVGLPDPRLFPTDARAEVEFFQKDSTQPAATLPANVQNAAAMTWKQPSEIISELKNAQRTIEGRLRHRAKLKEIIRELSEKKKSETVGSDAYEEIEREIKEVEDEDALTTDAAMDKYMRDWNQPWSEYQTHVRLLRLDVEAARESLAQVIRKRDRVEQLVKKRAASQFEAEEAESQFKLAEIQLRRAEALLKLYTDIETNEPKLNPDYKAPPAEEATEAIPE
jgi:thiol-disulfide isomerase/thioredoxin